MALIFITSTCVAEYGRLSLNSSVVHSFWPYLVNAVMLYDYRTGTMNEQIESKSKRVILSCQGEKGA